MWVQVHSSSMNTFRLISDCPEGNKSIWTEQIAEVAFSSRLFIHKCSTVWQAALCVTVWPLPVTSCTRSYPDPCWTPELKLWNSLFVPLCIAVAPFLLIPQDLLEIKTTTSLLQPPLLGKLYLLLIFILYIYALLSGPCVLVIYQGNWKLPLVGWCRLASSACSSMVWLMIATVQWWQDNSRGWRGVLLNNYWQILLSTS